MGVVGYAGIAGAKSGAKVGTATAGQFTVLNAVPGTTITNAYGVYIADSGTSGTITNRYDLFASSGNANNYFAGKVGIGTTNPADKLEVNGTTKFDGLVSFASGQAFPGAALLSAANTFTGNQSISGNLTTTGSITGSTGNFAGGLAVGSG